MRHPASLLALSIALLALPAASQQGRKIPAALYIDVATHNMVGMPDMGGMLGGLGGFMAKRVAGSDAFKPSYPSTRVGGLSGQYLDVALHNTVRPGTPAQDLIPAGLKLGKALQLVPFEPGRADSPGGGSTSADGGRVPDVEVTIREYWGCGAAVRPGQPKQASFRVKGGFYDPKKGAAGMAGISVEARGSLSKGLYVPDRDIELKPGFVYWPSPQHAKQVPNGARLAGGHQITGNGIPASMSFDVDPAADFMPKLALQALGEPSDAMRLGWPAVDRARAYFISAMKMEMLSEQSFVMTTWSSADVAGAGNELHAYLTGGAIDTWLKRKILLPPSATSCVVPKGIFAGGSGGQGGMIPAMLMMTAYGPEHTILHPPKPADPKQPWDPEWSVRLRAKSTATAMLGLDLGAMGTDPGRDGEQPQRPGAKSLLKGILGR